MVPLTHFCRIEPEETSVLLGRRHRWNGGVTVRRHILRTSSARTLPRGELPCMRGVHMRTRSVKKDCLALLVTCSLQTKILGLPTGTRMQRLKRQSLTINYSTRRLQAHSSLPGEVVCQSLFCSRVVIDNSTARHCSALCGRRRQTQAASAIQALEPRKTPAVKVPSRAVTEGACIQTLTPP